MPRVSHRRRRDVGSSGTTNEEKDEGQDSQPMGQDPPAVPPSERKKKRKIGDIETIETPPSGAKKRPRHSEEKSSVEKDDVEDMDDSMAEVIVVETVGENDISDEDPKAEAVTEKSNGYQWAGHTSAAVQESISLPVNADIAVEATLSVPDKKQFPIKRPAKAFSKEIPQIDTLRMPSEQTPARLAKTETSVPMDNRAPLPASRLLFSTDPLPASSVDGILPKSESSKPEPKTTEPLNCTDNNDDQGAPKRIPSRALVLTKASTWFFIFLLLQMILFPLWINPILSTVADLSTPLMETYQSVYEAFVPPKIVANRTAEYQALVLAQEQEFAALVAKVTQERDDLVNELSNLQSVTRHLEELIRADTASLDEDLRNLKMTLGERKRSFAEKKRTLSRIESLMLKAMNEGPPDVTKLRDLLHENSDILIDTSPVKLWPIPELPTCDTTVVIDESDAVAVPQSVEEDIETLKEMARLSTEEIKADAATAAKLKNWIHSMVADSVSVELKVEKIKTVKKVLTPPESFDDDIWAAISATLESHLADNGIVDYGAVRHGSMVIRHGPRASTPSLEETLPFLNRLMASAGLRFYGHRAEIALTATNPPEAIGQCWAFQKDTSTSTDKVRGKFGTLTFALAKPVVVYSIVIEHPPRHVTDHIRSAIRSFRVIGYKDPGAVGEAIDLGAFDYDIDAENHMQEFELDEDEQLLGAVTLAVDSTWGAEYACLYRIRVLGDEPDE